MTNKQAPEKRTSKPRSPKSTKTSTQKTGASRHLSSASKLENLKKEAKRWLKQLHDNDPQAKTQARERLKRILPSISNEPTLREVQRALALEHGFEGWAALKKQLDDQAQTSLRDDNAKPDAVDDQQLTDLANLFLEYACADPILCNGPAAHARRGRTALRMLARYPQIAGANIHTAAVCGDIETVERIIKERPEAATEPGGPLRRRGVPERHKLWTPILHLCYGRLPTIAASENAVAIARALLDNRTDSNGGADPNDYFEVGSGPCRYTTLCGVAGEGEDDAPPHPQREALARLLLERGAEPYDVQLRYNTHFHGDILWQMKLVYEFSIKAGRRADWEDPDWEMLSMGGYGCGARWHLDVAVSNNNIELAEWLLEHGANPNAPPRPSPRFSQLSMYQTALRQGATEVAEALLRYGAKPESIPVEGIESFTAACFKLDRAAARKQLAKHPNYLKTPEPIFAAAGRNRSDVVEFLLDLGVSIEIEDSQKNRPLHIAASHDSLEAAKLLVERGAEIDPVETQWNNTPLDYALYGNHQRMIEFLSRVSRDVFLVTYSGNIERLRELLNENPELARAARDENPLLMWLPEDEARAAQIVELLVPLGANPAIANPEGMTPADLAERRGLYDLAALLRKTFV